MLYSFFTYFYSPDFFCLTGDKVYTLKSGSRYLFHTSVSLQVWNLKHATNINRWIQLFTITSTYLKKGARLYTREYTVLKRFCWHHCGTLIRSDVSSKAITLELRALQVSANWLGDSIELAAQSVTITTAVAQLPQLVKATENNLRSKHTRIRLRIHIKFQQINDNLSHNQVF